MMMNWSKKFNNINTADTSNLVTKKLTKTQKLMKLKKKTLIMIMLNILLIKTSTS